MSVSVFAQDTPRLDPDNLLVFRSSSGVEAVKTNGDWSQRRQEIVAGMEAVMGRFPQTKPRPSLDMEVVETSQQDGYVRQLITYRSEADSRVPAYLCIPDSVKEAGKKVPAVLCLHPTDNSVGHKVVVGLGGRAGRQYATELAERGFVTIAPAYPQLANYWPNLGKLGYESGTMKAIWDNTRAIDLLEQLPYVDSSNGVGAIGHSLGGHNAIYTAVFEPRISVVVSSCGFDSFRDYYDGVERVWFFGKGWCQTRYMPRMSNYRNRLEEIPFDFPELLGCLAPRPLYVNAPLGDSNFRWKSVDRCVNAAREIYQLHDASDRINVDHPDIDHNFPEPQRKRAYETIESVLK